MRRIPRHKLRNIMFIFFGTGAWGLMLGYVLPSMMAPSSSLPFYMTILGATQLGLGAVFGWMYLTREPESTGGKRSRYKRGHK